MTSQEPSEVTNLDIYGSAALPWSRPRDMLAASPAPSDITFFLGTVQPDGRPHAAGIGALWLDGDLYFTSGPETRKARNLATNPACTRSCRLEGIDLVLEGEATRVTDKPISRRWRRRRACTVRVDGLPRWKARRSRLRSALRAPDRRPGSSIASPSILPSASPRRSRTARPAGASSADRRATHTAPRMSRSGVRQAADRHSVDS